MDSFVLGAQLLLTAVFITAGVGKLLDQPGSRGALADFGVPEQLARAGGVLLPLAELATAVALVFHSSARWGAVAALVLLLAFIGGIARALSRGRAPDCHCFGQLHSAPAGRGTLARNAVLAVLAAIVAVHGPGPALDDWVAARTAAELVAVGAGICAVALALLCVRLWLDKRSLRDDLAREREWSALLPPGLPLGASAPAFSLPDLRGETVTLDALLERGRPVALVFVSPSCGPCAALLPDLGRWQATVSERLTIGLLTSGSAQENTPAMDEHRLADVLLQDGSEVMDSYRVRATPAAVVVAPDRRIASISAHGVLAIESLIRLTLQNGTRLQAHGSAGNGAEAEQQQTLGSPRA